MADDRAASAVVGKALEAGLVVLYVGLVTSALLGGVVPGYRTAAGEAVAERTLAAASQRVQQAVPPGATAAGARVRVSLPDTIRGRAYEVRASDRTLVLVHPVPAVGTSARPALPSSVVALAGRWESTAPAAVVVHPAGDGLVVELVSGGRR